MPKRIDLRIKNTNGDYIFSLKVGALTKNNRKEIDLPIPKDKIKQAFEFLKFQGYSEGMKAKRNATIYQYKDIEWAIIEVPNHSFYFEAEKLVKNKRDGYDAQTEIRRICNELNLEIFTEKECHEYIQQLNREVNKKFKL